MNWLELVYNKLAITKFNSKRFRTSETQKAHAGERVLSERQKSRGAFGYVLHLRAPLLSHASMRSRKSPKSPTKKKRGQERATRGERQRNRAHLPKTGDRGARRAQTPQTGQRPKDTRDDPKNPGLAGPLPKLPNSNSGRKMEKKRRKGKRVTPHSRNGGGGKTDEGERSDRVIKIHASGANMSPPTSLTR